MPSLDLTVIRETAKLEAWFDKDYHLRQLVRRRKGRTCCPKGCSANCSACSFDLDKNVWHCHRCKEGGGLLEWVMLSEGLPVVRAAHYICQTLHIPVVYLPRPKARRPRRPRKRDKEVAGDGKGVI